MCQRDVFVQIYLCGCKDTQEQIRPHIGCGSCGTVSKNAIFHKVPIRIPCSNCKAHGYWVLYRGTWMPSMTAEIQAAIDRKAQGN